MNRAMARLAVLKSRLGWELRRGWDALDAMMLVAIALIAFWLGAVFTINAPLQRQADALAQKAGAMRNRTAEGQVKVLRVAIGKGLVAFFPSATGREKQLQRLHALAAKEGLQLVRADYRSEPVKDLALQGFAVRLSLQGNYTQQRQFLHAVLAELPNLAVTRISLEKAAGASEAMSAVLEARLYYRPERDVRSTQR
jgi:Tfp pilus assembly protein PilO